MSISPLPVRATPRRPGQQLVAAAAARVRKPPNQRRLARRHLVINLTKLVLPAGAALLLATLALWPEISRMTDSARIAYQRMSREIGGATVTDAHYRGVDEHGRPYTLTAATAVQVDPERINLTTLKGDITLANGTWLMVQAKHGVFLQHTNQLDLSGDVTLYRDDGTTMTTASASIDLKKGAAASAEPTHAEGPFGTLDAQGFTATDQATAVQFAGPAHLVLNGASP
ncbi:MAG TPA: LPS export ABC transporter periplasmic protein LptC [Acetobacteraceae bacterium]|nr:LPS export ABC transporter periplasmic protein LptC [Acetobacteraceae bacterium]